MKGLRLIQLDFLRGCAVLLVMGHHGFVEPARAGAFLWPAFVWWRLSNSGVDLFFVLSGFLIGGLLFQEWKRSGDIDIKRFLIRRGFKIWPSYFVYVFVAIFWHVVASTWGDPLRGLTFMLPNLLHLQNYLITPITHTWSLSVEEHFYLALPFVLVSIGQHQPDWKRALRGWGITILLIIGGLIVLHRILAAIGDSSFFFVETAWMAQAFQTPQFPIVWGLQLCLLAALLFFAPLFRSNVRNEFSVVPALAFSVLIFSATMRIGTTANLDLLRISWPFVLFATHLRLDGFAMGLILAWFYAFRPTGLERLARRRIILLMFAFMLLGLVVVLPDGSLMIHTIEPTLFSMAYACLLLALLYVPLEIGNWAALFRAWPMRAIIFVGAYSYTIYLWHITPARLWVAQNLLVSFTDTQRWILLTLLHLGISIFLGWLASRLIEMPLLHVRDRLFPAKARALVEGS